MEKLSSKTKNLNFFRVPFAAQAGPGRKWDAEKIKFFFWNLIFRLRAGPSRKWDAEKVKFFSFGT